MIIGGVLLNSDIDRDAARTRRTLSAGFWGGPLSAGVPQVLSADRP